MKVFFYDNLELIDFLCFSVRSIFLLLVASFGGFFVVKCLIKFGADIFRLDGEGNGMVNFVVMRFYINVLEYFIEWGY